MTVRPLKIGDIVRVLDWDGLNMTSNSYGKNVDHVKSRPNIWILTGSMEQSFCVKNMAYPLDKDAEFFVWLPHVEIIE